MCQTSQFHYWNPNYLNLVAFQSMYWERELFFMRSHVSYITPLRIICIYVLLEFSMFCITLSCIQKATEYPWQNYVTNMARQGTWGDTIINQAVSTSLKYITINIRVGCKFLPSQLQIQTNDRQKIYILAIYKNIIICEQCQC